MNPIRHKRGDIRSSDGKMFWQYSGSYEYWVSQEKFAQKKRAANLCWTGCRIRNPDGFSARNKRYYINNIEKINARKLKYHKRKIKESPSYHICHNIRGQVYRALVGIRKSMPSLHLLGCSVEHLKRHISSLFQPGMNWGNYGKWEIDHRVPSSLFNLNDPDQQRECFGYKNLQPLWKIDNQPKGNHYDGIPPYLRA